ncbi:MULTISPECIES: hypothetical protein [unclassified Crossiella]|uniref:hypothetical protein n=1 Tax=unclassified Crossiella TaxID=2620835 RepID=UPI00200046CE|nr:MULTISPECIES: hypothetical protein [unclassified Crossiella]MCK2237826.1 hypothetical protein [Crossiella sp. S99.2]MCK2255112.1 hypothetical protein [Crossiella sp. S99.1]
MSSLHVVVDPDHFYTDCSITVYKNSAIRVESWNDEHLLLAFDGPGQRIVVALDRVDFDRLHGDMALAAESRKRAAVEPGSGEFKADWS